MNILKILAVKDVAEATRAIPIIDFSPAFGSSPDGLEAVAREVRRGCETAAFFSLARPRGPAAGGSPPLPIDEKMRLQLTQSNTAYLPVNQSIQKASTVHKATRPNYNESF